MYTQNFTKWLFNYMKNNSTQPEKLQGLLEQCNYCESEASLPELEVICKYFKERGESKTRAYVATAIEIQEGDLEHQVIDAEKIARQREAAMEMLTPKDYVLVSDYDPDKFRLAVNSFLDKGMWHLAGGVSVAVKHTEKSVNVLWSQALYRYF